jgi:proteasome lid subunit RPN8/RPN11
VKIAKQLLSEIVAHAQENPRIECCGVVAVRPDEDGAAGKTAARVYRAENIHASALKFEIAPMELYRLNEEIEQEGWEIGAIYHSHVRSAPYPSQTDIGFAAGWPGLEWIIVGLAGAGEPEVRSYLIDGADVGEIAVEETAS